MGFQGIGFRGKIFDINIYGSSMKEREVKSIYAAKEEKCACERGELFWLAKSSVDAEMYVDTDYDQHDNGSIQFFDPIR